MVLGYYIFGEHFALLYVSPTNNQWSNNHLNAQPSYDDVWEERSTPGSVERLVDS